MIQGYTFDGANYPAAPFAKVEEKVFGGNEGILNGVELANTTTSVSIGQGDLIIKGRHLKILGTDTVSVELPSSGTLYCILAIEIDLTKVNTELSFNQADYKILSSYEEYPSLTKQDINSGTSGENVYQFPLARFTATANGIDDFTDVRKEFGEFKGYSETILFEGNSANATLTDNYTNYDELEVETEYPSGQKHTWIIENPTDNYNLRISSGNYDGWIYFATTLYELKEGNKIQENLNVSCVIQGQDGFSQKIGRTNKFKITKVTGIKKGI